MKDNELSGIYCIKNILNNKVYIGRDNKVKLKRRWYAHISKLRKNNHTNNHLQASWNKYGEENFLFSVLEFCSEEDLNSREVYYIEKYKSNDYKLGYNLTSGGDGNHKWKPSDETKKKISISHMGEKNPMYGRKLNETQRNAFLKKGKEHPSYGKHWNDEMRSYFRQ